MKTPKIIHQIWGGYQEIKPHLDALSNTWKNLNPSWKYEFWDDNRIDNFVTENYPQYLSQFRKFPYNMQRWDTVRYFILEQIGGLYADFDSECLMPIEELLGNKECWFSLEPEQHAKINNKDIYLSSAVMGSVPNHPFIGQMIVNIFSSAFINEKYIPKFDSKPDDIVNSTGPLKLTETYEMYKKKSEINLISRKDIASYTFNETQAIIAGNETDYLANIIDEAYIVHYFFHEWIPGIE